MSQATNKLLLMQQFSRLFNFSFFEFSIPGWQLTSQMQRNTAITLNQKEIKNYSKVLASKQPQIFRLQRSNALILAIPKLEKNKLNGIWLCFIPLDSANFVHTITDKSDANNLAATLYLALYHVPSSVKLNLTQRLDSLVTHYAMRDLLLEELKTDETTHYYDMDELYKHELLMLEAITAGNLQRAEALIDYLLQVPEYVGMLSSDPIKRVKEFIIVTVVISSRAANAAGVPSGESYFKGDKLIREAEKQVDLTNYKDFTRQIVAYYTKLTIRYRQQVSPYIFNIEQYLQQHIYQPITVATIAQKLNVNATYLSRLTKSKTGLTLKQYILKHKITEARYLLQFSARSVQEISLMLNFSDPSHLTRVFRQYTGKTPSEYRKQRK
ncbi:helix-turn-helix domain-containing protein [Loigolactobacillus iwatensis]|uniref:helix-turn-helix domain-containing protein n=1 Tax=Loigolactobacillus iwatensis TaxID=1267156 RepID=UPI000F7E90F0|nr:AraC family transcriptional regulator [Loigolactobacillus iwatensis]